MNISEVSTGEGSLIVVYSLTCPAGGTREKVTMTMIKFRVVQGGTSGKGE